MNGAKIPNDWFKKFLSFGINIGSGEIIDTREAAKDFVDMQHQMNFMFLLLHALSKSTPSEPNLVYGINKEERVLEINEVLKDN